VSKKKSKSQLEELKSLMQRLQADFENHKKRSEKEKAESVQYANQKMVLDLLPVLDSFESALGEADDGLRLIYAQIIKILGRYGVKKIKAKGEKFNPDVHEAMMTEEGEEDDIVLDEMQSGYVMNDLVVRPAKVKISKKKNDNKKNSSKKNN
jgi:molecular chaperone GrpE